jgi:hypothetical protein
MVDISALSAVVVAVSVVVGLIFTLMELRHLTKTRRTDVIMRIYDRFGSKEMVEAIYSVGQLRSERPTGFPPKGSADGDYTDRNNLRGTGRPTGARFDRHQTG